MHTNYHIVHWLKSQSDSVVVVVTTVLSWVDNDIGHHIGWIVNDSVWNDRSVSSCDCCCCCCCCYGGEYPSSWVAVAADVVVVVVWVVEVLLLLLVLLLVQPQYVWWWCSRRGGGNHWYPYFLFGMRQCCCLGEGSIYICIHKQQHCLTPPV